MDIEAMTIQTNLMLLKKSRVAPVSGDIFVMKMPPDTYLFGRVILAEPPRETAPGPSSNLIYVYDFQSKTKSPDESRLGPHSLLIPPIWTNRLGWSKGYFETIKRGALETSTLLSQHCFKRYDGVYLDEEGRRLPGRIEPCGEWGLVSYRWIDDRISDAIGMLRVPERGSD
jgi:hypothetical protein